MAVLPRYAHSTYYILPRFLGLHIAQLPCTGRERCRCWRKRGKKNSSSGLSSTCRLRHWEASIYMEVERRDAIIPPSYVHTVSERGCVWHRVEWARLVKSVTGKHLWRPWQMIKHPQSPDAEWSGSLHLFISRSTLQTLYNEKTEEHQPL